MMIPLAYATLYFGLGFLLVGSGFSIAYLRATKKENHLETAGLLSLAGTLCLTIVFVLRLSQWRLVPLTTGADNLVLFIILSSVTGFFVSRQERRRALQAVYLPPTAAIALVAGWLAWGDFAASPKALSMPFLVVHVITALLAYALFYVASVTSLVYAIQARRLKSRNTTASFHSLPSLENLDKTLYQLIWMGYPLLLLTMVLGLYWAWTDRQLLGSMWWFSPKILLSILMVLLYAACFHLRILGWLRGPKLANLMFVGFGGLLLVYLLLEVLRITNYNFWVAGT